MNTLHYTPVCSISKKFSRKTLSKIFIKIKCEMITSKLIYINRKDVPITRFYDTRKIKKIDQTLSARSKAFLIDKFNILNEKYMCV